MFYLTPGVGNVGVGWLLAQTLEGPFLAVSKPILQENRLRYDLLSILVSKFPEFETKIAENFRWCFREVIQNQKKLKKGRS